MSRRLRREFQELESQLEPNVVERAWRALIDKALYDKGDGPKPIVEQLRLREKIRTRHARRDRYNQIRYARRYTALSRLIGPRHIMAVVAIHAGIVECSEGPFPRDLILGAMAVDRRLTRKFLEELETIHETIEPALPPWEIDHRRIDGEKRAQPIVREERRDFEESLKPTPLPTTSPAKIQFGFTVPFPLYEHSNAPDINTTPAARAAS